MKRVDTEWKVMRGVVCGREKCDCDSCEFERGEQRESERVVEEKDGHMRLIPNVASHLSVYCATFVCDIG